ncbi:putative regulator of chromosome condensation 1/beta-lactamase-inhibitor protein II [Plasmopara halstedii]
MMTTSSLKSALRQWTERSWLSMGEIPTFTVGGMHSLACDSAGRIWAWGCNFPIHRNRGAHNAIISTSGEVFVYLWLDLYNQLGHCSTHNDKGLNSDIAQVACGTLHTAASEDLSIHLRMEKRRSVGP